MTQTLYLNFKFMSRRDANYLFYKDHEEIKSSDIKKMFRATSLMKIRMNILNRNFKTKMKLRK